MESVYVDTAEKAERIRASVNKIMALVREAEQPS